MPLQTKKARLYRFFQRIGVWAVALFAWIVSTLYFLFMPSRVGASFRFYRALFPLRSRLSCLGLVWRQFHSFAALFSERLLLEKKSSIKTVWEGFGHLKKAADDKQGLILVMSHLGNWEIAARLLRRQQIDLLLFMGTRKGENVERLQKKELKEESIQIVATSQKEKSVLDGLDGLKHLRQGGIVSMAGDRKEGPLGKQVAVHMLGREILLSQTPFRFAQITGVPWCVFFAVRTQRGVYRIKITQPKKLTLVPGKTRSTIIREAAQEYATLLEQMARDYPEQWYHFKNFPFHHG